MRVKANCQASVDFGKCIKVLLTWQESPSLPEEYCWLNVLRERGPLDRSKTYRITIEEEE